MIHIRKMLFYLFLLVALSAASATAVLQLSGDSSILTAGDRGNVQTESYVIDETGADPAAETNRVIGSDIHVSVVSGSATPVVEEATEMETVGDDIIADEFAANTDDALLFEDDAVLDVDSDLFIESAPDIMTSDAAEVEFDPVADDEPQIDFMPLVATREAADEEDWVVFDSNEIEDEDLDDLFDEEDVAANKGEISFKTVAAVGSAQDTTYAESFDASESLEDEIIFDSNDVADEESDALFDDDAAFFAEDAEEAAEDDEIVFDSNVVMIDGDEEFDDFDDADETDDADDDLLFDSADEEVAEDEDVEPVSDEEELVADENADEEETFDAELFDSDAETEEVAEEEDENVDALADEDFLDWDSDSDSEQEDVADVDEEEEASDENDLLDENLFGSDAEDAAEDDDVASLISNNEGFEISLFDSETEEEAAEEEEEDENLFDTDEEASDDMNEEEIVESDETVEDADELFDAVEETEAELDADEEDALSEDDFFASDVDDAASEEENAQTDDEEDLIEDDLFDDAEETENELDPEEDEIIFDDNDVEALPEDEETDVEFFENDEEETNSDDEIVFDSNDAPETEDALPSIDALEQEASFFEVVNPVEEKGGDLSDSSAAVDKDNDLETVKADDEEPYAHEVVYDSNASTDEQDADNETADANAGAGDETNDAPQESGQDSCQGSDDDSDAAPCGPVLQYRNQSSYAKNDAVVVLATDEEKAVAAEDRYQKAPVTERVSSQAVVDEVPETNAEPLDDELWIASQGSNYLWKYENGSWSQKETKSFFSSDDPRRVTIVWVHGYQTDMNSAAQSGFLLKSVVDNCRAASGIDRKYRIVVWKWNSERFNARIRVDAKEKKDLAFFSGSELGKFVGRLNSKDDVVLVGFSFGAVVTGSALQTLATKSNAYMNGHKAPAFATSGATAEPAVEEQTGRLSLILVSAACDLGAFQQGGYFSAGAQLPTRVLNVYNPNDYALRFYPMISETSQALGIAPLWGGEFVNAVGATYNLNVNGVIGKEHSFNDAFPTIPAQTLSGMIF